jgi:hypothetical protein
LAPTVRPSACRFRLRIFRNPDRPVVVLLTDHEREVSPGVWFPEDPYVVRMRAVYADVAETHGLDRDCLCWIERNQAGRFERVEYRRAISRWGLSPAAVDYLVGRE